MSFKNVFPKRIVHLICLVECSNPRLRIERSVVGYGRLPVDSFVSFLSKNVVNTLCQKITLCEKKVKTKCVTVPYYHRTTLVYMCYYSQTTI